MHACHLRTLVPAQILSRCYNELYQRGTKEEYIHAHLF
jgi:hypothetical protein